MENEKKEVEEKSIQTINPMPIVQPMQGDLDSVVRQAEKNVQLQDKLRKLALKLTNVNDWIDEAGKPYLQWTGAAKIARGFGVSYRVGIFEKESQRDTEGEYIIYTCAGEIIFQGNTIPEIGTASTRDSFFGVRTRDGENGKKEKYYLPLSEVDLTNVKKKAQTNFLNRGLKSCLGLSFTWEEIEEATNGGIKKTLCVQVGFHGGAKGGSGKPPESQDDIDRKNHLWEMILEYRGGDEELAKQALAMLTTFKTKDGKQVPGKTDYTKLTKKQVDFHYDKIKKDYDEWRARQESEL